MNAPPRLWSVTTLIREGLPKPALLGWAVKVTAEYAVDERDGWLPLADRDRDAALKVLKDARWRTSEKAAARGTDVHKAAEQLALGEEPDIDETAAPYVDQYRRFLDEHEPKFVMAEAPVYNLTYHYAGTLDAIVEIGGKRCLLDVKTTDKPPTAATRPPYPDIALQCVAYSRAEQAGVSPAEMRTFGGRRYYVYDPEQNHLPLPELDGALALVISPSDYQLVPVRVDDEVWQSFLHVREVARWQLSTSKNVLGPTITAPAPVAA